MHRERTEGVQNYDANYAKHILKKGRRFKDQGAGGSGGNFAGLDEDEPEMQLGDWEDASRKKLTAGKQRERQGKGKGGKFGAGGKGGKGGDVPKNLQTCPHCLESVRFAYGSRGNIVHQTENIYIALENPKIALLPGEMIIATVDHSAAPCVNECDENVYDDIMAAMRRVKAYFNSGGGKGGSGNKESRKAVVFLEQITEIPSRERQTLGAGPHCVVRCFPIEPSMLAETRSMFRESLVDLDAEDEFSRVHQSAKPTRPGEGVQGPARQGGRGHVAKRFPYLWMDFNLEGGLVHPVDSKDRFRRDWAKGVLCGALDLDFLTNNAYKDDGEWNAALADVKRGFGV